MALDPTVTPIENTNKIKVIFCTQSRIIVRLELVYCLDMKSIIKTIPEYNKAQITETKMICDFLELNINSFLKKSESKIWHGSPVWFINGNPIVAYSVRKNGSVSLMFFSGQSFKEKDLIPEGKFKAAEIFYTNVKEIKITYLKRWLKKAEVVQWDYKNIVKNKGKLSFFN